MNATGYTAVKAVYDRKNKAFTVEVVRNADINLIHAGYLVYDDAARVLQDFYAMRVVSHLSAAKRVAIERFLVAEVANDFTA